MEEDVVVTEEVDGEVFVGGVSGGMGGVADDGVPAGFGVEEFASGVRAELGLEVGVVFADPGEELGPEGVALVEERGECGLGGGAEGEVGVGDDFEAVEGRADERIEAGDGEPCDFHLRECGNFGEAAEGEGEGFGIGGKSFTWRGVERKIEEDFVDDQREVVFLTKGVKPSEFFGFDVGAGWIVGVDEEDGTRARGDGAFEGLEIDEPAVGIGEGIGDETDVLQAG